MSKRSLSLKETSIQKDVSTVLQEFWHWLQKEKRMIVLIFLASISVFGIRFFLLTHESPDYTNFTKVWFDTLRENPSFSVFKTDFYNYNPPYLYLLWFVSKLGSDSFLITKLLSIVFDVGCAIVAAKILSKFSKKYVTLLFFTILLLPTVILNSSMWGQADAIYTFFVLLSVYFSLDQRWFKAFLFLGIGVAFKAQALFLLPAFFIFWLLRFIKTTELLKGLVILLFVMIASIIPAALTGRDITSLLTIYANQSNYYTELVKGAPNLWQWFRNDDYNRFKNVGYLLTTGIVAIWGFLSTARKVKFSKELVLIACTMSMLLVPFFLPKMHDRYFFSADILTVVLAFAIPKAWWIAVLANFASWYAYMDWTWGLRPFEYGIIPFFNLAAIIGLVFVWSGELKKNEL
jgi:Gpi18-like mannosyltransferase